MIRDSARKTGSICLVGREDLTRPRQCLDRRSSGVACTAWAKLPPAAMPGSPVSWCRCRFWETMPANCIGGNAWIAGQLVSRGYRITKGKTMTTDATPAAQAWQSFVEHAALIEGQLRAPDTVIAGLLHCNPRIIRRRIRHHRLERRAVATASGRLGYWLNKVEFYRYFVFDHCPAATVIAVDFCDTVGGLMRGRIPSPNAECTIAVEDLAERLAGFRA